MSEKKKKFTVMFYFASDNPLAASIVSQLKSIKNAGYHPDVNVIAQFDPNTEGTPTHVFEVNLVEKLRNPGQPDIGFASDDPFVRNLLEDKLWRDQQSLDGLPIKKKLADVLRRKSAERLANLTRMEDSAWRKRKPINYRAPVPPDGLRPVGRKGARTAAAGNGRFTHAGNGRPAAAGNGRREEASPQESLHAFLEFCATNYQAEHYLLFILGHGVVVGNDIFLFDENAPEHSLTLLQLHEELASFKGLVDEQKASFDLVGFHSCSVSSLEVAYQLQGTADYMLASQGPAFVGSWPYRQMLIRIFNEAQESGPGGEPNIENLLVRLFNYCYHNSTDFLLAGYSFDITLCNLRNVRAYVGDPLKTLSDALLHGLRSGEEPVKDAILLAHWKSQSYWRENYTDLADFCFRLREQCGLFTRRMSKAMKDISEACEAVETSLDEGGEVIVRSGFAGPAYQYSHGLSVFFPWSEPTSDGPFWVKNDEGKFIGDYKKYEFERTFWRKFLDAYFRTTMRETRLEEDRKNPRESIRENLQVGGRPSSDPELLADERALVQDIASLTYNQEGQLSPESALAKTNPQDGTGDDDDDCPTFKNFPRDTRARRDRGRKAEPGAAPVSIPFAVIHEEPESAPPAPVPTV